MMLAVRRFLKTIPGMEYCYGQLKLQRFRRAYAPEFAELLDHAPPGVSPLQLANSLNQFEWVVGHAQFPAGLLERLMPDEAGVRRQSLDVSGSDTNAQRLTSNACLIRAFRNFSLGYVAEEALAREWQHSEAISERAELRLTEFLNRYITYALRTFGVYLELHGNPESSDAIRLRRVLQELEGETGDLLDVGCAFVPLADRYQKMRSWVGLDLSLPALMIGRLVHGQAISDWRLAIDDNPLADRQSQTADGCTAHGALVCGYSEDLPFADGSFDVLVSSEVLEHTPRPERMIQEMARVLRGGGKAVVTVPMHIVDYQDGRQHLIGPTDSTHRFHFHSLEALQALFTRRGLAVERVQASPHYTFTLRREKTGVGRQALDVTGSDTNASRLTPDPSPLACPDCRGELQEQAEELVCSGCGAPFPCRHGIRVLLPQRLRAARLDLVE